MWPYVIGYFQSEYFQGSSVWSHISVLHYQIMFPLYGYTTLFIKSPVNGHLGCYHFLAILNYTTITVMYKFCGVNCQAIFKSNCVTLHSYQKV